MADEDLRKLEREAANDPAAERKLQRARIRGGALAHVWMLQYSAESVGLDGSIVGLFTTRQACINHIKKHKKHFRPGIHGSHTGYRSYDESFNQWTNGYRGLIISKAPIHDEPTEEWFATHEKE